MVEFLSNSVPLTHGDRVYPWMHLKSADVTTRDIHVLNQIDMEDHQIVNYDMTANRKDLPSLRWQVQSVSSPPLSGEIWIEFPLLNMPNDQTILINKQCRLERTVSTVPNWTTIELMDVDKSVLYKCTLSSFQTLANHYSCSLHVDDVIGSVSSVVGSVVEMKPISEGGASALQDLTDVALLEPSNNQVLGFDGLAGKWKNMSLTPSGEVIPLNDLSDVTISEPSANQVVSYNAELGWVNRSIRESQMYQWRFGGYYTTDLPLNFFMGYFWVDAAAHTIILHVNDASGASHETLLAQIATGYQIQLISDTARKNNYVITAKYRSDVPYQEYIFNENSSLIEDTFMIPETLYEFLIVPFVSHTHAISDASDVTVFEPVNGQTIVWADNQWVNSNIAVAWNDVSSKPSEFNPSAHSHDVNADGITVQGNGNGTALSTNEYQWKFGGTYNGVLPAYQSGEFWIDDVNNHLLLHKFDALGLSHGNLLASLEYCSQIIFVSSSKQRNRYSISSIDNQAFYVEYVYQTDAKLTVLEEPMFSMVVGKPYQFQVLQQPVFNLDHLLDVVISSPNDGELLEYDVIQGWINKSVPKILPMCSNSFTSAGTAMTLTTQGTWYPIELTGIGFLRNTNDWSNATDSTTLQYNPIAKAMCFRVSWDFEIIMATASNIEFKITWLGADLPSPSSETLFLNDNLKIQHFGGSRLIKYETPIETPAYIQFLLRSNSADGVQPAFTKIDVFVQCDRPL